MLAGWKEENAMLLSAIEEKLTTKPKLPFGLSQDWKRGDGKGGDRGAPLTDPFEAQQHMAMISYLPQRRPPLQGQIPMRAWPHPSSPPQASGSYSSSVPLQTAHATQRLHWSAQQLLQQLPW